MSSISRLKVVHEDNSHALFSWEVETGLVLRGGTGEKCCF